MQDSKIKIGDIVSYRDSRKRSRKCRVISFENNEINKLIPIGETWFNGMDIKTKAKVFYPLRKSMESLIIENKLQCFCE
jgi:hypothetical protein